MVEKEMQVMIANLLKLNVISCQRFLFNCIHAGIYAKSAMGTLINSGDFEIPNAAALPSTNVVLPNVIIGDEAFALTGTMMKPYPRAQSVHDTTKAMYNYRHSRARRTTENVFGIMASYFLYMAFISFFFLLSSN